MMKRRFYFLLEPTEINQLYDWCDSRTMKISICKTESKSIEELGREFHKSFNETFLPKDTFPSFTEFIKEETIPDSVSSFPIPCNEIILSFPLQTQTGSFEIHHLISPVQYKVAVLTISVEEDVLCSLQDQLFPSWFIEKWIRRLSPGQLVIGLPCWMFIAMIIEKNVLLYPFQEYIRHFSDSVRSCIQIDAQEDKVSNAAISIWTALSIVFPVDYQDEDSVREYLQVVHEVYTNSLLLC